MALLMKPFKAFRPQKKRVEEVILPTFDNLTPKQLNKILKKTEYNFLNVVSPKAFYPNISKTNSKKHAYNHLNAMISNKILIQEKTECLYIYRLNKYNKNQYGIVTSIEFDEGNKKILKHEAIFKSRSTSILETIEHTKMQIGPVYLSYNEKINLDSIFNRYVGKKPLYKFKTAGGTTRSLWRVSDQKDIYLIKQKLSNIKKLYIADGHHRYAAIENLSKKINKKAHKKKKLSLLAAIFSKDEVNILSFHRLVKFKKFNKKSFLYGLKNTFLLKRESKFRTPCKPGSIMMYVKSQWYNISLQSNDKVYSKFETDVDIIEKIIIKNIANKKSGNLVSSLTNLPGKFAYKKLVREVNDGRADAGFFICPLPMKKIMSIADRGMIVPKKSTYFDPKPADGLVNLQMDF